MKKGFTLVEMLVVIGIIAVLTAATLMALGKVLKTADGARNREIVSNAATALQAIYNKTGQWPKSLRKATQDGGSSVLDAKAAYAFVKFGMMKMDSDSKKEETTLHDRFGLVTPYAMTVIRRLGDKATESSKVNGTATIADHRLRFAIDMDGDGVIEGVDVGGETLTIRANAVVWCCGKDGVIQPYSKAGRSDDVHSWTKGQVIK